MRRQVIAAASLACAVAAAAQPASNNFDAMGASAEITNQLARRDVDAAAGTAARLMPGGSVEKLRDAFQIVRNLGHGQYADLVYARDHGRTEKDLIYKIDFDRTFLFVRYLYHVDHGAWRLIRIHLKAEDELPFPKEWVHIYPK